MEIVAPNEWFALLDRLSEEKTPAILLGAIDAGKTTLAKFLITHLCQKGIKPALVDADIGQSVLGPPTTIGLSLFESVPDWERIPSPEIFFVGSTSPEGNLSLHLRGLEKMVRKADFLGTRVILIDTTGLVYGEVGRELKRRKIDLLSPCSIVALQRFGELEPILELYKESPLHQIHRLPISDLAKSRSKEERRAYRIRKFQEYFRDSEIEPLMIDQIRLEGDITDSNGFPIPVHWALGMKGLLLGLKDGAGNTLALAVAAGFDEGSRIWRVLTPLKSSERVSGVQLSALRLTPSFDEERL